MKKTSLFEKLAYAIGGFVITIFALWLFYLVETFGNDLIDEFRPRHKP